jgi:hypothetical protein
LRVDSPTCFHQKTWVFFTKPGLPMFDTPPPFLSPPALHQHQLAFFIEGSDHRCEKATPLFPKTFSIIDIRYP